jgi:hypothetical protein
MVKANMSEPGSVAAPVAMHPYIAVGRRAIAVGISLLLVCPIFVAWFGTSELQPLGLFACLGLLCLAYGSWVRRLGYCVAAHNATFPLMARDAISEALAVSLQIPERYLRRGAIARAVLTQRGVIHSYMGESAHAESLLTRAISLPRGHFIRTQDGLMRAGAYVQRGFVRAAMRNGVGARDDLRAVRASEEASPENLALALLAEAVLASHDLANRAALGSAVKALGPYVEYLGARERTLARGLRLSLRRGSGSMIYRETAAALQNHERSGLAAWLHQIAPDAATELPTDSPAIPSEVPLLELGAAPADVAHVRSVWKSRVKPRTVRSALTFAALFAGLFAMVLALSLLNVRASTAERAGSAANATFVEGTGLGLSWWIVVLLVVALTGVFAWQVRRVTTGLAVVTRARRLAAAGEIGAAEALLQPLQKSGLASVHGSANLTLASLSERRGEFTAAIAYASTALAKIYATKAARQNTSDLLAPGLLGARAFCNAASGQLDSALADLSILETDYPGFAYLPSERFRVTLAILLARRDVTGARALAAARPMSMNVPIRVELLCDLLLATANPGLLRDTRGALQGEIAADPTYIPWIDALAPNLWAGFAASA